MGFHCSGICQRGVAPIWYFALNDNASLVFDLYGGGPLLVLELERIPFPGILLQRVTPLWYLFCRSSAPLVFGLAGHHPPSISLLKDNTALVFDLNGMAPFRYLVWLE